MRYQMNDFQHLAGLIADDPDLGVDARNVVATGGSYGGGFAWLALTDPTWESPGGEAMALSAVAPRYGWTDLVYSLVPNGHHRRDALPAFDGSTSVDPLGFPKRSILAGLFASGTTGVPPGTGGHATFPPSIAEGFACLNAVDPYALNPLCAQTLATTLPAFIEFKSAHYRNGFFERLRTDPQPACRCSARGRSPTRSRALRDRRRPRRVEHLRPPGQRLALRAGPSRPDRAGPGRRPVHPRGECAGRFHRERGAVAGARARLPDRGAGGAGACAGWGWRRGRWLRRRRRPRWP
ncbi:MAG: hypothetical protein M3459_06800 [Actinomycetota bacterium]|nr:hypothetical protein [Actinomycetota bacterium]